MNHSELTKCPGCGKDVDIKEIERIYGELSEVTTKKFCSASCYTKSLQLKTTEQIADECETDLKEIAHFYGGWDELREVIKRLEDNDNEAAWERHQTDY